MTDPVYHPSHYAGKIETWDFIADHDLNFLLGSAIKYITRAGKKGADTYVTDLRKAIACLEKQIDIERGKRHGR